MEFRKSTKRVITRRGVVWLGQTCNIRCHFCYFLDRIKSSDHPEHPFMSLEKAKFICFTLRHYYNNVAIDIQGGEPLLFAGIYDLIRFCDGLGLYPTLITNGILLAQMKTCVKLKEAGVRDLLISVHALDEVYDSIVGTPGASKKQMLGIQNCRELGIPFRFNVVLSKWALPQYAAIAKLAAETGAKVVNFIAFNPFEDQASGKRNTENVARYSEVAEELNKALDLLEDSGIEANVRYLPICMVSERHRKSMHNFQQLPYDLHEWDYASWSWTGQGEQRMRDGDCSAPITLEEATYSHGRPLESIPFIQKLPLSGSFSSAKRYVYEKLGAYPETRLSVQKAYHSLIDWTLSKAGHNKGGCPKAPEPNPELYRANARLRAEDHCRYTYSQKCSRCIAQPICDGFHGDYVSMFGSEEACPIEGTDRINDPCHFTATQEKIVEKRDYDWVFDPPAGQGISAQPSVPRQCPICSSEKIDFLQSRSDGEIMACRECEHLFLANPAPAEATVEARYQGVSYWEQDRHHQGIKSLDSQQEWERWVAARWVAINTHELLDGHKDKQLRILEVGCSEGKVLAELRQKGHLVIGIEANREVAVLGRKQFRVPVLGRPVESCEFQPDSFDVIMSFHCLEHLVDPADTVRRCHRWLAPGGKLFFEVPLGDEEIDNLDHFHFFSVLSASKLVQPLLGNVRTTKRQYRRGDGKMMGSICISGQKIEDEGQY